MDVIIIRISLAAAASLLDTRTWYLSLPWYFKKVMLLGAGMGGRERRCVECIASALHMEVHMQVQVATELQILVASWK